VPGSGRSRDDVRRERLKRVVRVLNDPARALFGAWRRWPVGSFDLRCDFDIFSRPQYAYGVQQGARLAQKLGIPAISAIEFGVAGGRGLVALEEIAQLASEATGVRVDVYGFDLAVGLPEASDYRDLSYTWRKGFFEMDVAALEARLSRARLVLGDIRETLPTFVSTHDPAPIGFVSIDLDYYTSTAAALRLFELPDENLLPRILCWFDDLVGEDHVLQNECVGELLAIEEFNAAHACTKVLPINGLVVKRPVPASWNQSMYAMHRFDHARYDDYVGPDAADQQLEL
jgi:hypothetical protein